MIAPRKKLWSSPAVAVDAALRMLALTPDDVLCDLGCGDGRALSAAAALPSPPRRCVGIEIDPERAAAALAGARAAGLTVQQVGLVGGGGVVALSCCRICHVVVVLSSPPSPCRAPTRAKPRLPLTTPPPPQLDIATANALSLEALPLLPGDVVTALYLYLVPRGLRIVLPQLRDLAAACAPAPLRVATYMAPLPGLAVSARADVTPEHQPSASWPVYCYALTAEMLDAAAAAKAETAATVPPASR